MQDPILISEKIFSFLDQSHVDIKKLIAQHKSPPLGSCDPEKWFPINHRVNKNHFDTMPDWARGIINKQCGELAQRLGYE